MASNFSFRCRCKCSNPQKQGGTHWLQCKWSRLNVSRVVGGGGSGGMRPKDGCGERNGNGEGRVEMKVQVSQKAEKHFW